MYMLAGLFYQKFRQTASREGRKYSGSGKPRAIAVLREYVRFPAHAVAARSPGTERVLYTIHHLLIQVCFWEDRMAGRPFFRAARQIDAPCLPVGQSRKCNVESVW